MSTKLDYQSLWSSSNPRMRGSPDFRLKYWQDLLGEDEVKSLIKQAWKDIGPGGKKRLKKYRQSLTLRVKHIDRDVLAAIVAHGRTGAQSTVHDMTGRDLGWYQRK